MLQSKTKRVATYGRKGRSRVVAVLDRSSWKSSETSPSRQEISSTDDDFPSTISHLASPAPNKISQSKSSSKASRGNTGRKLANYRPPLASLAINAPSSPALPKKLSKARNSTDTRIQRKPSKAKPKLIAPYIDVDDAAAALVKKRRVSLKGKETVEVELSSDSDDNDERDAPRFGPTRKNKRPTIVLSDTESELDTNDLLQPRSSQHPSSSRSNDGNKNKGVRSHMHTTKLEVEVVIPTYKSLSRTSPQKTPHKYNRLTPTRQNPVGAGLQPRRRQVTPSGRAISATLSPHRAKPTIEVFDVDESLLSLDEEINAAVKMAGLHLNEPNKPLQKPKQSLQTPIVQVSSQIQSSAQKRKPPAAYLRPILSECGQLTPFDFDAFLKTLPSELLFTNVGNAFSTVTLSDIFIKVGEASYSEVFGFGNVVLKIIPLFDEGSDPSETWTTSWDPPQVSVVADVVREINVTRAMGETCKGFIKLIKAHVVQGPYPEKLLSCWDEFEVKNGSESVRPDHFSNMQAYAIIVLPNGGPDLEAFSFSKTVDQPKLGWLQACSIFWQVAKSLATAEELLHFEHRDLHWGQILVRHFKKSSRFAFSNVKGPRPMDDPCHGISTTIIDLGLARINQSREDSFWTPFDNEIFEGEGDYQYDVYRMMREHNGDEWESFRPLSNVMWLHYLLDKLLHHKGLRAPSRSRRSSVTTGAEDELRAYECIKVMETFLGNSIYSVSRKADARIKRRVGSANISDERPDSAIAVMKLGRARGWIM